MSLPRLSRSTTRAIGRSSSGNGIARTKRPSSTACASASSTSRPAASPRTRARAMPSSSGPSATSYRPQLFWKWDRADEKTFIDSVRYGLEHESNGGDAANSRSLNTVFIRPEWPHSFANRHEMQFMPKFYSYLEKDENPDIAQY